MPHAKNITLHDGYTMELIYLRMASICILLSRWGIDYIITVNYPPAFAMMIVV